MEIVSNNRSWASVRREAVSVLQDVRQCAYCKESGTFEFGPDGHYCTIDHVMPSDKGGKNELANLVKCCNLCNARKHTKTTPEWTPSDDVMTAAGVTYGQIKHGYKPQFEQINTEEELIIYYEKRINKLNNRIFELEKHIWNSSKVFSSIRLMTEITAPDICYTPSDEVGR